MGRRPSHTLTVIRKRGGAASRRVFLGAGRPAAQTHFAHGWHNPHPVAVGHGPARRGRGTGSRRPFLRGTRNFSDLAVGRFDGTAPSFPRSRPSSSTMGTRPAPRRDMGDCRKTTSPPRTPYRGTPDAATGVAGARVWEPSHPPTTAHALTESSACSD